MDSRKFTNIFFIKLYLNYFFIKLFKLIRIISYIHIYKSNREVFATLTLAFYNKIFFFKICNNFEKIC